MAEIHDQPSPAEGRYDRQTRYPPIGTEGQERIAAGRVLICGCGALGSVIANTLARAGVGTLRIVDRDLVDLSNLQRQVLFDERDAREHVPKAIAAARRLGQINSSIKLDARVVDVNHRSIAELVEGIDLLLDGTDNFETRFLLNDAAHHFGIPWIYGGCIGAEGQCMTILPGVTPCFRCLVSEPPPPGSTPTCDTAGIISPIVNVVAAIQSAEALKLLSGQAAQHQSLSDGYRPLVESATVRGRIQVAGASMLDVRRGRISLATGGSSQPNGRAVWPQCGAAYRARLRAHSAGGTGPETGRAG